MVAFCIISFLHLQGILREIGDYDTMWGSVIKAFPKRYQNSDALQVQTFGWGLDGQKNENPSLYKLDKKTDSLVF